MRFPRQLRHLRATADTEASDALDRFRRHDSVALRLGMNDREDGLFLASIKDAFTCEIVDNDMNARMTEELLSQALWTAVKWKRLPAGMTLHSDRGSQYCYRKQVEQFKLCASMSRRGNRYDNAPLESFWGSLKSELKHHHRYETRLEAEASIREYIEFFYNRQRRHSVTLAWAMWRLPSLQKL